MASAVTNFSVVPDVQQPASSGSGRFGREDTGQLAVRDLSSVTEQVHNDRCSTPRHSKSFVDITFHEESQKKRENLKNLEVDCQVQNVHVRRIFGCYTTFFRPTSQGFEVDHAVEELFTKSRSMHFRTAFMVVSFTMMLGTLVLGALALQSELYWRAGLLAGGVAPFYLCYGVYAHGTSKNRRHSYLETQQAVPQKQRPYAEKLCVGALCVQTLIIVFAEWVSPDFDYGMLVVHIGFVHNFTPLGAGAMQIVTAACGVLPYVVLMVIRSVTEGADVNFLGIQMPDEPEDPPHDQEILCKRTSGSAAVLVRIVVPIVMFVYQGVVTFRRDESLRLDWLNRLTLRMQETLLATEKQRNEGLLGSMLPRRIIEALKANDPVEPQHFENVTVIFIEICEFDRVCAQLLPSYVVEVLNIVYLEFDRLSDLLRVYKVETVGQVYMAVVGCPDPIVNHADVAAHFALAAMRSMTHIKGRINEVTGLSGSRQTMAKVTAACPTTEVTLPHVTSVGSLLGALPKTGADEDLAITIHVGLNSGPIRAGIVGIDSPRYKLFGDTVNTASRMESTCEPGKIQLSSSTVKSLSSGMFRVEDRGEIQVKGKGTMTTSYLVGYRSLGNSDHPRRVVIEHGSMKPGFADNSDDLASADQAGGVGTPHKARLGPPLPNLMFEGEILRHCTGDADSITIHEPEMPGSFSNKRGTAEFAAVSSLQSTTSAMRAVALGKKSGASASSQDSLCTAIRPISPGGGTMPLTLLERLWLLFLLVPKAHKHPKRFQELRQDLPNYREATRETRLLTARNLTVTWLLLTAVLAGTDYFLNTLDEDLPAYRTAIIIRTLGNSVSGLGFLLLVTIPTLGKVAQKLTITLLACQAVAILACGVLLYNNEPAMIALYGVYILFYTVCTLAQRLLLCLATVLGYVLSEWVRCGHHSGHSADNISFLVVFIASMVCSVRLEEYLQHVSYFEQSRNEKRLKDISQARAAGWQLLTTLLPPHVVKDVGDGVSPIAEHHSDVTIIFTDIKGFTAYSSRITIHKLVTVLNSMYSAFDEVISNWGLHKVEIIGDAYFISAGCPPPPDGDNALQDTDPSEWAMRGVEVGLALLRTLPTVCEDGSVQMRVGLHSGSVVAGVVGKKGPRYHLFGSTVAYAEKMESHGIAGKVQLSSATHVLLEKGGHQYDFEERDIHVEGEDGPQRAYLVNRSNAKVAFQIQKKLMSQRRHVQTNNRSVSNGTSASQLHSRPCSTCPSTQATSSIPVDDCHRRQTTPHLRP